MVTPISDSAEMIRQMRPERGAGRWAFHSVSEAELADVLPNAKAVFREDEGVCVLVPARTGEDALAQITLQVVSALDGVGLTAAVSATLAEAGIPCNVIAARLHDHIFVPEMMADRAVTLLERRAAQGGVYRGVHDG
ncbi:MAG: ACT domain-containing protein [Roseicyclus sp.]|nr:ACT domain-containing protein [Roseicyclus sp.]